MAQDDQVAATAAVAKAAPAAPVAAPAVAVAQAATPAPSDQAEQELTLHEYCIRLSKVDKRVEMIAAFNYTETMAGTIKDIESAFAARYNDFLTKPVKG